MKKRICILLMMGLCLAGCGKTGELQNSGTEESDLEYSDDLYWSKSEGESGTVFPDKYEYHSDKITADIELTVPEKVVFYKGTAEKIQGPGSEELAYQFIPEEERMVEYSDGHGYVGLEKNGTVIKAFSWAKTGTFDTYNREYSYVNDCLVTEKRSDVYNLNRFIEKKDFSFDTSEEALEQVVAILTSYGIELGDNYTVDTYYLSHEIMAEEENHEGMDGNDQPELYKQDWSSEDDLYLFYFHQTYCGLEDYHGGGDIVQRVENSNAPITVFYGVEGIVDISYGALYQYDMSDEVVELMPFDEVILPVIDRFENVVSESQFEIVSAELYCDMSGIFSDKTRTLVPAWAIGVVEHCEDYDVTHEIRINAETGMIMQ